MRERDPPRSPKGRKTRAALLRAAREVFERDGFLDARIADISDAARLATGSFYTYFADKDEAFAAVLREAQDEMVHPGVHNASGEEDPVKMIEVSNRVYLEAYRRNAKLMRLLEQVATIDEDFRTLQRERARAFAERNIRSLRRLQDAGQVDPEIDAKLVSIALGAMVSRVAYLIFVLEFEEADFDEIVDVLTQIWVRTLGISQRGA